MDEGPQNKIRPPGGKVTRLHDAQGESGGCLPVEISGDHTQFLHPSIGDINCLPVYMPSASMSKIMLEVVGLPADGDCLHRSRRYVEAKRKYGEDWPCKGLTMIGKVRLNSFMSTI